MAMTGAGHEPWLARFLAPRHAYAGRQAESWSCVGEADTPAADARCRLYLCCDGDRIVRAAFSAFGPPVAIACADWLCERLADRTIGQANGLTVEACEQSLALAADQRYAGLLVLDALADALRAQSNNTAAAGSTAVRSGIMAP